MGIFSISISCSLTFEENLDLTFTLLVEKKIYRCIPYKFEETVGSSNCNVEKNLLVLMISSPDRDDLVFPKVSIFLLYLFHT